MKLEEPYPDNKQTATKGVYTAMFLNKLISISSAGKTHPELETYYYSVAVVTCVALLYASHLLDKTKALGLLIIGLSLTPMLIQYKPIELSSEVQETADHIRSHTDIETRFEQAKKLVSLYQNKHLLLGIVPFTMLMSRHLTLIDALKTLHTDRDPDKKSLKTPLNGIVYAGTANDIYSLPAETCLDVVNNTAFTTTDPLLNPDTMDRWQSHTTVKEDCTRYKPSTKKDFAIWAQFPILPFFHETLYTSRDETLQIVIHKTEREALTSLKTLASAGFKILLNDTSSHGLKAGYSTTNFRIILACLPENTKEATKVAKTLLKQLTSATHKENLLSLFPTEAQAETATLIHPAWRN